MSVVLYEGSIRLNYLDKSHYYSVQERINWDLPEDDTEAWGKKSRPKGTTTLLGDTLEKKGLMTWPMGMALGELFGFYNFEGDDGTRRIGFSKDKGTLWADPSLESSERIEIEGIDKILPIVKSASENWIRKQKKGADIGSIVHEAIEHFVKANPNRLQPSFIERRIPAIDEDGKNILDKDGDETFDVVMEAEIDKEGQAVMVMPDIRSSLFDISEQYMWNLKDNEENYETPAEYDKALEEFPQDVEMAQLAFNRFVQWWSGVRPELLGAEDLVYSKEHHISGTFDGLIKIGDKTVLVDWKTSNASKSKAAAMPEGINYQYFIQSAIYAMAWREMHQKVRKFNHIVTETVFDMSQKIDDLAIVSCRKDGEFTIIFASDLGLSIDDCMDWARAVIACHKFGEKTRKALIEHAEGAQSESNSN